MHPTPPEDLAARRAEIQDKLRVILASFDASFAEREEACRLIMLAVLSGHHVLLLGPPGTGKSLLARAACSAFRSAHDDDSTPARYFEYLLTRFSHPDEIFGPISLPGLKQEDYRRITDGYLPRAEIAFIDEIFKANSAILNSLLGIINERIFHCGRHRERVPLVGLIGASNEPPDPEGGLGALWDRFVVRIEVSPVRDPERFLAIALGDLASPEIAPAKRLSPGDIALIRTHAAAVTVPDAIRRGLVALRSGLRDGGIDASDRRFRQALELLRIAAWTAGREVVGPTDFMLLSHCFGDPMTAGGTVRMLLRRALDEALAPVLGVDLADGWRNIARSGQDETASVRDAYESRFVALERFETELGQATDQVEAARSAILDEVESSPWLTEVPGRLLAVLVGAQRQLDAYRAAALRHRDELSGLDLHGDLLRRLKLAQAGPVTVGADAALMPLHTPTDAEVALWLVPPGEEPDGWIPLSATGWLLFDAAPRIAGRVQRKLLDRALAEGRNLDEARAWFTTVTTLELNEAAVFALGSNWPKLQRFATERGFAPGSPALAALRALSEHLRASGMPRLPPLPKVDLPDPGAP